MTETRMKEKAGYGKVRLSRDKGVYILADSQGSNALAHDEPQQPLRSYLDQKIIISTTQRRKEEGYIYI